MRKERKHYSSEEKVAIPVPPQLEMEKSVLPLR
jgi:hypothetical protein